MKVSSIVQSCRNAFARFAERVGIIASAAVQATVDLPSELHVPEFLKSPDAIGNGVQLGDQKALPISFFEFDCIHKLQPGEPYFVLRGQDATASGVVRRWIEIAQRNKVNPEKIASALAVAEAMERYPHSRKPD
jgi:hypothetical protein